MEEIKNIIIVLSGKGGVGKSTLAVQQALSLHSKGFRVGVLDIDLTGPSIPRMLSIESKQVHQSSNGWIPVHVDDRLCVMSIGFLLQSRNDAVVWRGPKKSAMIKQFLNDVVWGQLDYLIIDTPPGTTDEHISLIEYLSGQNLTGALVVTTPQQVSLQDVRKELSFCKKLEVCVLGIVENMSGFVCPCCGEVTDIFSKGGGEHLATEYGVEFLGRVPIDGTFTQVMEGETDQVEEKASTTVFDRFKASYLNSVFEGITDKLLKQASPSKHLQKESRINC